MNLFTTVVNIRSSFASEDMAIMILYVSLSGETSPFEEDG